MQRIHSVIFILITVILSVNVLANVSDKISNKVSVNHIDANSIKSTNFELEQSQTVGIEFIAPKPFKQDSVLLAWILDLDSRKTVWRSNNTKLLDVSDNESSALYSDQITLQKGRYGVFYTTYNLHYDTDVKTYTFFGLSFLIPDDTGISHDDIGKFYVDVKAKVIKVIGSDNHINPFADKANMTTLLSMTKVTHPPPKKYGFEVKQDSKLSIYSIGEFMHHKAIDGARLTNFNTGELVWEMTHDNTVLAGGANKNRLFKGKVFVSKGRYVLTYFNDDSHHYNDFNDSPPFDPEAWGISVYIDKTSDKNASFTLFNPKDKLKSLEISRIEKVGDNAFKSQHFTLNEDIQVRVMSLGENKANGDLMADFGWILDNKTQRKVWEMTLANSTHAGGANRNHRSDEVINLPAGEYSLHYVSDDSHSYQGWDLARPEEPEHWGITLYGIDQNFNPKMITVLEKSTHAPLIELTRMANDALETRIFTLNSDQQVRIYSIGESYEGEMVDYAYIRNIDTGKRVWSMFYDETEHAGGGEKNRLSNDVIELKQGQYKVTYVTDSWHSYGQWNEAPPYDQYNYGVSVFAVVK